MSSLREATVDYLARLDRDIDAAQQAVRAAGQDPDAQRAARAYLDGRIQEWIAAAAWVRSINAAAAAVLAVTEGQQ
jgi:hypothetical protein